MTEPTTITCLNGHFTRADRAAVSVADRGFRFGDGVFETIRITGGVPYQWALHMARLAQGLHALSIPTPVDDFQPFAKKLLQRNKIQDGFIRLAISRGVGSRGYAPHPPRMPVTWVMESLPPLPAPEKPYQLWLSSWAKIPTQCLPTRHKLAQGLNSILALNDAAGNQCDEALQLTTEGFLSEAASANLFWFTNGTLFTPNLDTGCLSGTTRDAVLRLTPFPTRMVTAGLSSLEKAEAVFLSNTRLGVWPVARLQPTGWIFDPNHHAIRRISELLAQDHATQRQRDAASWIS